ncbi:SGNH hydrolase-type esterase domain-containing protein [Exophiala viscosa]|uniref:SGNH hydrolase-type esterase domain-containing protein n=1 Tax=Exophiala viscosa TaxID=2486360 RepID=A0AAN6E4Y8_9EURO|nr:SGNH hydrolase-type esterase domain-containing protein [Exophiala viscosa]KAI1629216.1 SGNH hydrolase-type esterase domain-containing protein [Exophiala viscosa]
MAFSTFLLRLLFLFRYAGESISSVIPSARPSGRSYAALGDSYAAGAGAGYPLGLGLGCGYFSDAYPVQVANNSLLDIKNVRILACGGATTLTVLHDQVPLVGDPDLLSITVSGNEVDFVGVLNECVYHFWPSSTCEAEVAKARRLIESALGDNMRALIRGANKRLRPGALLIVTGYARFFNPETDICDHATFSRTRPLDYLTKAKRRKLNGLVDILNDVIRATAEAYGAVYLDIDAVFEGHRFCEEGVQEPDVGRDETWFFNIPAQETLQTQTEQRLQLQTLESGQVEVGGIKHYADAKVFRIFHPTSLGHTRISEALVEKVMLLEAIAG